MKKELTQEIVREFLHYNPDTGIFTWLPRARRWFKSDRDCSAWNTRYAGHRAGAVRTGKSGYKIRCITLLGKSRKEHHLAWVWMAGTPLPNQIDHRNRNATENNWDNLVSSTGSKNMRNASMRSHNTSGVNGVVWRKDINKWQAQCTLNGKNHHLGVFASRDDADKVSLEFRAKHGFDPEHGLEPAHYA